MKKNLAEKFDRLPQDFDRLAIWNGIERPKKYFMLKFYFFRGFLASLVLATLFLVFTQSEDVFSKDEKPASIALAKSSESAFENKGEVGPIQHLSDRSAIRQTKSKVIADVSPILLEQEKTLSPTLTQFGRKTKEIKKPLEKKEEILHQKQHHTSLPQVDTIANLEIQIPDELYLVLKQKGVDLPFIDPDQLPAIINPRRHSLSIRAGIGSHQSHFLSTLEESLAWANRQEKPQLGYNLGLRYEYLLKNNFLLSINGGYQLYKANINTRNLLDSMGQALQIDYDLYNHYHLFTGNLELGKRFHHETFFWDILGGLGLKFKQFSEVDYFIKEGELARKPLVKALYKNSGHVFYSLQTSFGKHLTDRIFIRVGAQAFSGFTLTGPQTTNRHLIIPFTTFLEAGVKF